MTRQVPSPPRLENEVHASEALLLTDNVRSGCVGVFLVFLALLTVLYTMTMDTSEAGLTAELRHIGGWYASILLAIPPDLRRTSHILFGVLVVVSVAYYAVLQIFKYQAGPVLARAGSDGLEVTVPGRSGRRIPWVDVGSGEVVLIQPSWLAQPRPHIRLRLRGNSARMARGSLITLGPAVSQENADQFAGACQRFQKW